MKPSNKIRREVYFKAFKKHIVGIVPDIAFNAAILRLQSDISLPVIRCR